MKSYQKCVFSLLKSAPSFLFIVILYNLKRCCDNIKTKFTKECLTTIFRKFHHQFINVNFGRKVTVLVVTVAVVAAAKSNYDLYEFLLLLLCFVVVVKLKLDRNTIVDERVLRENPTASKVMANAFFRFIDKFTKGDIITRREEDLGDTVNNPFISRLWEYVEDERLNRPGANNIRTKILKKIVIFFHRGDECRCSKESLRKQEIKSSTFSFVTLDEPLRVEYRNAYNENIRHADLEVMRIQRKNDNDEGWTNFYIFHLENRALKILYKNYKEIGFDKRDLDLHIQLYYQSLTQLIEADDFLKRILKLYQYEDYEINGGFYNHIKNFIDMETDEDMWMEGGSWQSPENFLE